MRISDWSSDVCSSDLLRIAAGGIGHDLRVGTDDTADEFSKIRLRVVLQQHGPNGAEPLRSDADELLLRALASLVLDAFLEPRGAAEDLVVELDGAALHMPKIWPLRPEEAHVVAKNRKSGGEGKEGADRIDRGG